MDTPPPIIEAPATVVPPVPTGPGAAARHDERTATSEGRTADETALISGGQRRVNLIWEVTQAFVALMLVATVCYSLAFGFSVRSEFWILVSIVVLAYFQRTNHTRVGGVGALQADTR